ncbi:MAG: glutathione-disulfide reductase [Phyllobacteriaceae bacterium]|nr:glutathione-disulfide reductase [Phyllobacteriaceae bacterium]
MSDYDFDLFVIGGGSGGVRAGRVAASMGKRVGVAEEFRFGGTCVIRGCVPKKLLVYASEFPEHFDEAAGFGWSVGEAAFSWPALIAAKDREIARLEGLYRKGLESNRATIFTSRAELIDAHHVRLLSDDRTVSAETILIATGGRPNPHEALPRNHLCISSNEALDLAELPKSIVIEGGGYIAVEFASIFAGLGSKVTLVYRGKEILSRFDADLRAGLHKSLEARGVTILTQTVLEHVHPGHDGLLHAHHSGGASIAADQVMLAVGRLPNTQGLGLDRAGVATDAQGAITVDSFSRTSQANIFAIGDVTNRVQLTPVAIHEAMCFIETAFKDNPVAPDHETIATAVFTRPEIGTVGMSEEQAAKRFGDIDVFRAEFRPMKATLSGSTGKMLMKLIVDSISGKIVGAHVMGPDAGEMAQLLAIPLKMGASKADFDRTMAVHPTAAEELVTMYQPSYRVRGGARV